MTSETIEWLSKEARRTSAFLLVINKINFNHQSIQTLAEQESSYISYLKECSNIQTKQTSTQLSLDWVCGLLTLRNRNCNCPTRSRIKSNCRHLWTSSPCDKLCLKLTRASQTTTDTVVQYPKGKKQNCISWLLIFKQEFFFLLAKWPNNILEYTLIQAVQQYLKGTL
jgi:hypothetical protein